MAFSFLLGAALPDTCFDIEIFELEEFEEREKEADEEKKQHPSKDEVNSAFSLLNSRTDQSLLELYNGFRLKSKYKDCYYGVITPPPKLALSQHVDHYFRSKIKLVS